MSRDRLRYAAAACQVDFPNPSDRGGIKPHVDRMLEMVDMAVELPNEHTERYEAKAKEHGVWIQTALENVAWVVGANQGASLKNYAPFSWSGGSMIVDYEGRIMAQADPGPGEKIVVATVDVGALRHERATRRGHQNLAHLRTETLPMYRHEMYPGGRGAEKMSVEDNDEAIAAAKGKLGYE